MNKNYPETVGKIVSDYIDRLRDHLKAGIQKEDQEDFIREMESHIYESYINDPTEGDVDRILTVLKRIGEPSQLFTKKMPELMVKKGKEKKRIMYIFGGILIALFGLPLGLGGVGIVIGIMAAIFGLLIAYYATAVSFVVGGVAGLIASVIHIIDPWFIEKLIEINGHVAEFHHFFANPRMDGVVGAVICILLMFIGVLMIYAGKYIFKGLRFVFNSVLGKIKRKKTS